MPPPPRTRRPPVVKNSCVSASAAPGFDGSVGSIRSSAPGESGPGFGLAAADARALGVKNEAEANEGCRAAGPPPLAGSKADVVMAPAPADGAEDVGAPASAGGALIPGVRIAGSSSGARRLAGSSLAAEATTRAPPYEMAWMHRPEGV